MLTLPERVPARSQMPNLTFPGPARDASSTAMTGLSAPTGQFLRSEAEVILATDFFTVDLLDGTTVYVLAVIEHATRRIRILGITPHPAGAWVTQQARNLLMDLDGQAATIKFLIRDRDTKFTAAFDEVLHSAHIRILQSPVQAPGRTPSWSGGSADADANCSTAP